MYSTSVELTANNTDSHMWHVLRHCFTAASSFHVLQYCLSFSPPPVMLTI